MENSQNRNEQTTITFDAQLNTNKNWNGSIYSPIRIRGIWASCSNRRGGHRYREIMVRSYSKTVQHLEGGIISDIFVDEGARVQEGDPY